jgi:hypothetical protein
MYRLLAQSLHVFNQEVYVKRQHLILALFTITGMILGLGLTPVFASTQSLVGVLTDKLGVSEAQATGGAGSIFNLAKSRLSGEDFGKVAGAVPGMESLLAAAPESDAKSGAAGSAASATSSMLGQKTGDLAGLTSLVGPFSKLGLSSDMIGKFVPIVLNYVGGNGGTGVQSLLASVLK